MKINLTYDNIVFSLQKAGGISVVWNELLKRALKDPDLILHFIEKSNLNIFREELTIPQDKILSKTFSKLPIIFQRYYNPRKIKNSGIFHSSYYRTTRGNNFKNITTVHDFTYEYYRSGLSQKIHSYQKGNAIRKSDRIICISNSTISDLLKFYPEVDESNIRLIYNGVDDVYRVLNEKKSSDLKVLVPFESKEYILYVGNRSSKYKNFNVAVKVSKETKQPLVLVGGGVISPSEETYLNSLNIKYNHLSGIDNSQLNTLYNHALCLLYPSLYEGFGIPVIEAQKAGCPVIATNISSIPEVIGPVETLLDNPSVENISEIIHQLKNNASFLSSQIEIGLTNSKRFSWDKCYRETKEVYKELHEQYF